MHERAKRKKKDVRLGRYTSTKENYSKISPFFKAIKILFLKMVKSSLISPTFQIFFFKKKVFLSIKLMNRNHPRHFKIQAQWQASYKIRGV